MITELPKSTRAEYIAFLKFNGDINQASRLNKSLKNNYRELNAAGVYYKVKVNMADDHQFVLKVYTFDEMTITKFKKIYERFVRHIESAGFVVYRGQVFAKGARKTATEAVPIASVNKFTIFSCNPLEPLEKSIEALRAENKDYHFFQVGVNPDGSQTWLAVRQYISGNIQSVEVDALKVLAHGFREAGLYTTIEQKSYNVYNLVSGDLYWD